MEVVLVVDVVVVGVVALKTKMENNDLIINEISKRRQLLVLVEVDVEVANIKIKHRVIFK